MNSAKFVTRFIPPKAIHRIFSALGHIRYLGTPIAVKNVPEGTNRFLSPYALLLLDCEPEISIRVSVASFRFTVIWRVKSVAGGNLVCMQDRDVLSIMNRHAVFWCAQMKKEIIMKKTLSLIAISAFIAASTSAFASSNPAKPTTQDAKASIETSIEKLQQSFSGMVKKTDNGLILETKDGMYNLKGLSLEEIVGKEVFVTGVVKNENETNTIYVVKADVKE